MFSVLGNNICGVQSKQESLISNLKAFNIGCFTLQESKVCRKGMIKIPGYVIFEVIRNGKEGGSLLTGIHENLEPVLVYEESDLEILVVQIRIGNIPLRIINSYGPQEYSDRGKIVSFYSTLDQIIQNSKLDKCLTLLQLDANAKVGKNIIKGDPYPQSQNGQLLMDLVDRNELILCNASDKCHGYITRRRITRKNVEESILDYLIVCQDLYQYLEKMKIDPSNIHSRFVRKDNDIRVVPSDHIPILPTHY